MADWAEIGEHIARVLGYKEMEFVDAYFENLAMTSGEAIDANSVATAIIEFMEGRNMWTGPSSKLLDELNNQERSKGRAYVVTNKYWPKGAGALSGKLAEIVPNLKDVSIICHRNFDEHRHRYEITLVNQNVRSPPPGEGEENSSSSNSSSNYPSPPSPPPGDGTPTDGLFGFGNSSNNNTGDGEQAQ
jgi:hypothetical protein